MDNWKSTLPTIAFYGIALGAAYILNKISPSGPCTPGAGILLFILIPIISFTLLLKNVVQLMRGQKTKKLVVCAHSLALATFISSLFI